MPRIQVSVLLAALAIAALASAVAASEPAAGARLRIGVAGLTHDHVHWLLGREDRGDVEIVGIAEPDRDLATRHLQRHGLPETLLYPDLESMLEATAPDAVTAFGSTRQHLDVVRACAPRGIHVMVEKPLAVSLDDAVEMARLARRHGILLLTNYETTWYGSNRRVRELVEDGTLGEIRKMVIHDGHPGPVAIGVSREFLRWLIDPIENGGGALTDFGCYGADLMAWLMKGARPRSVTAVTQQFQPEHYPKVDDEATVVVAWPHAQGIIQASWNWPQGRKDTHVYGQKGYAKALDRSHLRVRLGEGEEQAIEVAAPPTPRDDPFAYLAAAVRSGADPEPGGLSSLELNLVVMEILDAARRSAESGRRVELPADPPWR